MAQKRIVNGLNVIVVDGPCSGTGNSEIEMGGTLFSQVRFADGTRIAGLMADGYLASFLDGRGKKFYIAEKAMRGYSVLLGVIDDDDVFQDIDDVTWGKSAKYGVGMGIVAICVGIPLSAIAVGIPVVMMGAVSVFRSSRLGKIVEAARTVRDEHLGPFTAQAQVSQSTWLTEKLKNAQANAANRGSLLTQLKNL